MRDIDFALEDPTPAPEPALDAAAAVAAVPVMPAAPSAPQDQQEQEQEQEGEQAPDDEAPPFSAATDTPPMATPTLIEPEQDTSLAYGGGEIGSPTASRPLSFALAGAGAGAGLLGAPSGGEDEVLRPLSADLRAIGSVMTLGCVPSLPLSLSSCFLSPSAGHGADDGRTSFPAHAALRRRARRSSARARGTCSTCSRRPRVRECPYDESKGRDRDVTGRWKRGEGGGGGGVGGGAGGRKSVDTPVDPPAFVCEAVPAQGPVNEYVHLLCPSCSRAAQGEWKKRDKGRERAVVQLQARAEAKRLQGGYVGEGRREREKDVGMLRLRRGNETKREGGNYCVRVRRGVTGGRHVLLATASSTREAEGYDAKKRVDGASASAIRRCREG